ncbi:protein ALP1-like [Diospyros lotus]|uniref:protein ALP1-like n=1 Tax=Diospyros lotus TaxID=55363 RepID=UPI002253D646|nr:protein ALP1-like [Diospyros lotus]XP_052192278.1 protein ALP1-like [Diospyros lotus]XP_052192279.1 protein ALP1-like [Diospyros lotus]XP_052192280.1 protein ALP1-like [Diospyros lotus]XP_052192281.1 protein ALP1-like [Diospyros lotus]
MDSRALAALLSSLVSEILLLLLLFPSANPLATSTDSTSCSNLLPLIHHVQSFSEIAATVAILSSSRKRKRGHCTDLNSTDDDDEEEPGPGLSRLGGVDSAIPRDPDSFRLCFRMSPSTFEWLAGLLEPLLECRDPVGSPLNLSPETRLGIGLFRLSTGADYPEISRRFRVSPPAIKFCVKQFCRVLCTNFRFWVGYPSANELQSVSAAFETLTGMPNCCGVIDCTRFKILTNNSESCVAAQIVVDSSSRILSIVAGFRGDKADSIVLKSSTLYKDIEGGSLLDSPPVYINGVAVPQYLVGDSDYPLLPWLLVPFSDPVPGSLEENFNEAHRSMRLSALKTISNLKHWGVLNKPIEAEFKIAVAYIGACSILHNVLLMREDYSDSSDGLVDCTLDDESSRFHGDTSMEENSIEGKASVIRSALATRAAEIHKSDR